MSRSGPADVASWPHPTLAARERLCGRCGASTLYGLDGDRAASGIAVDVEAVTYLGAVVAALSGRRVCGLAGMVGVGGQLFALDDLHLTSDPATTTVGRYPLHIEHACPADPASSTNRRTS